MKWERGTFVNCFNYGNITLVTYIAQMYPNKLCNTNVDVCMYD